MKHHHIFRLLLAAQLLWATGAFAQTYKVESLSAIPSELPKPLQEMLNANGTRLVTDQGVAVCEVWLRKDVPTKQGGEASDILFGALNEGAFIGVLHFDSEGADYRGQTIKPGFYTLRYALIPQDGNHMGVNPYRDSLLLSPVAVDTELTQELKFDDLVKISRQSSGTPHPGFLIMSPVSGDGSPSVVKDDLGHWNLELKLHGQGGDFPIAITLVGKWEG